MHYSTIYNNDNAGIIYRKKKHWTFPLAMLSRIVLSMAIASNSALVRTDLMWATSSSLKFKVFIGPCETLVPKSWIEVSEDSCMDDVTFNEANGLDGSLEGEDVEDASEPTEDVVDSVEDFLFLDSHKVMECLLRIFSAVNFARSLATEK